MKCFYVGFRAAIAMALALSQPVFGQNSQGLAQTATVMGTVADINSDAIPNATVVLKTLESKDPRTIMTTGNGTYREQLSQ